METLTEVSGTQSLRINQSPYLDSRMWIEDRKVILKWTSHNLEWQALKWDNPQAMEKNKNDYNLHIFIYNWSFKRAS